MPPPCQCRLGNAVFLTPRLTPCLANAVLLSSTQLNVEKKHHLQKELQHAKAERDFYTARVSGSTSSISLCARQLRGGSFAWHCCFVQISRGACLCKNDLATFGYLRVHSEPPLP